MTQINIIEVEIDQIKPYAHNPRKNDKSVKYVKESIEQYGFQQPIVVDANNVIIVGHTRYKAAKQLGLKNVPIIRADNLSETQVQAYRIADNKTNQYAKWDESLLAGELSELLDNLTDITAVSSFTAFSELEIERLLNDNLYNKDIDELKKIRDQSPIHKRVGLLVLKTSYVNRGVATYVNGWLEWGLRNNVQVDVISNSSELHNNQFNRYDKLSNWQTPFFEIKDTDLINAPQEFGDSNDFTQYFDSHKIIDNQNDIQDDNVNLRSPIIRLRDSVDLRDSIISALSKYHYDALILNTIDTLFSVVSLNLHHYHPNIYYVTHSPIDVSMRGFGQDIMTSLTKGLLATSGIKIITQSEWMKQLVLSHFDADPNRIYPIIPMLGQPELLTIKPYEDREGILFIGPYEQRKSPEIFIEACKNNQKPAIVITPSQKSADKFKKRFIQEKIPHKIYVGLSGKNKVDVIRTAALCIIPSMVETFCFTAFEAAHLCRTIIPADRDWAQVHAPWCHLINENEISNAVMDHYNKPILESSRIALQNVFNETDKQALKLLDAKTINESKNAFTKYFEDKEIIDLNDFFLSRPSIVIDEMFYVIKAMFSGEFNIVHTKEQTIVSKK